MGYPYSKRNLAFAKAHEGSDCPGKLLVQPRWRTIGTAGDGIWAGLEVKRVNHVFCKRCAPDLPEYGSPISVYDLDGYSF